MYMRSAVALAIMGYSCAFSGMSSLALKPFHTTPTSISRVSLRSVGPSMKIGVFYGTSTGNTESVATRIAAKLGAEKCEDISSIQPSELADYDTLILGAPTWHTGEDKERSGTDWDSVIYDDVPNMDLSGKKVAFFGCGDSMSYGDYFCDAMGELYDQFSTTGATVIGKVPVKESIECIASKAIQGDVFVGLATDEDNLYDETDGRIEKWTTQLKTEGCA